MKKSISVLVAFLLFVHFSYSQDDIQAKRPGMPFIDLNRVPDSAIEKGIISIKFKKGIEKFLKAQADKSSGGVIVFNIPAVDALNKTYKVNEAPRAFEVILKETARDVLHKDWGLHLWYQLRFPANVDIKKMIRAYASLDAVIEVAEPVYKKVLIGTAKSTKRLTYIPNDPRFAEQWHYNNTGQNGGTAGDDIHLPAAWDIEKGNPNVIVAVIDQGIQTAHPDLAQNIWSGVGFNFVNNTSTIDPGDHGSHTSGTIAAVNNNGVGVSGIAGGDGTPASGVRLMSCEVFGPSASASNFGSPFIWAADHGAAIAQNSWGYNAPNIFEQAVKDAIDYFIANGGGTVMQGGIVIFSAGNSNSEGLYYPGAYSRVVSVAATNNSDIRSYYSNFGTWVSISAPGGEQFFTSDPKGVLSTVNNGGYDFFQGTSMACPHVSGVAALILSHAPNRLSPDDIKSILLTTTDNHYPVNAATYAGKLGSGRLNAFKALQKTDQILSSPLINAVSNSTLAVNCPNITVSWTKNIANNDVLVAYSADGNFGIPSGSYAAGDIISGGGTVEYIGSGSSFNQAVPKDSSLVYFKIWSTDNAGHYSLGTLKSILTPYTIVSFSGTAGTGNIVLNWTKKCPNSDVIVAFNTSQSFGDPVGLLNVGNTISGGGTIIYKGPATSFVHNSPVTGRDFYKIWPVNGTSYSYGVLAAVCYGSVTAPITESFESALFPPSGWAVVNPDNSLSWERTTLAAKTGVASSRISFYNYAAVGQQDYLLSPNIDAASFDTAQVSFSRAYRKYDASTPDFNDTLMLQLSTDCGLSFPVTIWKKGGTQLVTNPATTTTDWSPVANDWLRETVDVKPFLPAGTKSFVLSFTGINAFGQNLYVDDININVTKQGVRDAAISKVIDPAVRLCSRTVTPLVEFGNKGLDTLRSVKLYYTLNSVLTDSVTWTGVLSSNQFLTQAFKSLTLPGAGNYIFRFYTSKPNGLTDQVPTNDSLQVTVTVFDPIPGPVKEGFEQTSFPPANWSVGASNASYTWQRNTLGSSEGVASAWMRNRVYKGNGAKDDLYSPAIQLNNADSVFLLFDVAHITAQYPGSTGVKLDTLEILLTKDCGKTFTSVYKKWGDNLQSVNDPNFPGIYSATDTIGFVPQAKNQWRTDSVNLSPAAGNTGIFQLVFRNINNNGNNIFLDNINIRPLTLPAKLKQQGYMISPNPSEGSVYVQHYLRPNDLRGLQVVNAAGQLVWQRQYNGNALSNIPVDLSRFAAGVYTFRLMYTNKVIAQRVIKIK